MEIYYDDGNATGYTVTTPNYTKQYVYTYDDSGRIVSYGSVKDGALNPDDCSYYHYDSKGQLVRADENVKDSRSNGTEIYEYDNRGNLNKINYCNYTSADLTANPYSHTEIDYSGENNVWTDAIETAWDYDFRFLYDENGNIIRFEDVNFNWTNGRQLSSIIYDDSEESLVSYTYDDNGIRTSRTFGDTTTYFTTIDGTITSQYELDENGNVINLIEFLYDSNNDIQGFTYENKTYFYIKNIQGDVINIADSEGNVLVDYYYHTWGYVEYDDNSDIGLGAINPIRYKGYYYDEVGLYYLQSRYYMPEWYRFINSDLPTIAQEHKDEPNGLNLFAYCCNDPVNNSDPTGYYNGYNAMNYAIKYYKIPNPKYHYYNHGDCANFVSQCLYAGGLKMNSKWHSYLKKLKWDVTESWRLVAKLYTYLVNTKQYKKTKITTFKNMKLLAQRYCCKIGDVVLFVHKNGTVFHATLLTNIIYNKKNYKLVDDVLYTAHTVSQKNQSYNYFFKNYSGDYVYVISIK